MEIRLTIELSKKQLDEAVEEYLARRDITFNTDAIYYDINKNGEITRVLVEAR